MRAQGAVRLTDAIQSVPGLSLFDDHGTGLQVQGFAPDYTLILIDGEPVIGRSAGTLDINRLTINGLDRIEIVRGPSSSLYGSEALAGVVNLVTARPAGGLDGSVRARVGTFTTTDLTSQINYGSERLDARVMVNRYASDGYDLTPATYGATAPAFSDWTVDFRGAARFADNMRARLGVRAAALEQESNFAITGSDGGEVRYHDNAERTEWTLHPEFEYRISKVVRVTTTGYASRYLTHTIQLSQEGGDLLYEDDFDQQMYKSELQVDFLWGVRHLTMIGSGLVHDRLGGDRYLPDSSGDRPSSNQFYAFGQHEWMPGSAIELNASARLDMHSDYASRVTPKLSLLARPNSRIRLRASVGSGFKAPAFRQFYLAFSNASAGYSVFGSTRLEEGIAQLELEGQIAQLFFDPSNLEPIRAENSVALNMGGSVDPVEWLTIDANIFYNDVKDLIETQPVAQKTNGQFVYGYFNLDAIYTRGAELQSILRLHSSNTSSIRLDLGYQYLQARDKAVVDQLAAGTVFGRDTSGRDYRLSLSDYDGMFGRSPHSATASLLFAHEPAGLTSSLRSRWRSRYGYRDLDGNGVANREDEFVPSYAVFDIAVTKRIPFPRIADADLQFGVDNIFDITRPTLVPSLPGRRIYTSLNINF